jgi:hypothetical protein
MILEDSGNAEIEQNLQVLNENCTKLLDLISENQEKLADDEPNAVNNSRDENENSQRVKNSLMTSLVSYSYEIAHTVKRIVCIMGHSENTNL